MDLIIVRHGKAESLLSRPDGSDFDRTLTADGILKVRYLAKLMKKLTESQGYENVKIIASASARTLQTANNIADIFDVKDVTSEDKLYHGDYYSILPELLSENAEADCIIIVGHNPNVYFLTNSLCDVKLDFKKGSFACVSLNDDKISGILKYFVSSDLIEHVVLEPDDKPHSESDDGANNMDLANDKVIDFDLNKKISSTISIKDVKSEMYTLSNDFAKGCESFKFNFEDPESIHQMRIKIRQLLSLLDFVKQDLTGYSYKHVSKTLRSINSDLSIIRDLDQLIFYLNQTDVTDYFKNMALAQRKEHEDDLLYRINTDTFHDVDNILSALVWIHPDEKLKHLDGYIRDLLLEIQKNKKKIAPDKQRQLHNIRIVGKKIKNMVEIFPDPISEKTKFMNFDIKKFVKRLGNINDYYNCLKFLDIFYKLSFKSGVDVYKNLDKEYSELKSYFKKLIKNEFKKVNKTKILQK